MRRASPSRGNRPGTVASKALSRKPTNATKGSPTSILGHSPVLSPKPEWNSLQNEEKLSSYKLSKEEIIKRKQLLMSKHNIFYNNGKKYQLPSSASNKSNAPSEKKNFDSCLDLLSEDDRCSSSSDGGSVDRESPEERIRKRTNKPRRHVGAKASASANARSTSGKGSKGSAAQPGQYSKEKYSLSTNMDFFQYSSSDEDGDKKERLNEDEVATVQINRHVRPTSTPTVDRSGHNTSNNELELQGEVTPMDSKASLHVDESVTCKPTKKAAGSRVVSTTAKTTGLQRLPNNPPEPLWNLFDGYSTDDAADSKKDKDENSISFSRASASTKLNSSHVSSKSHKSSASHGGNDTDMIAIFSEIQTLRAELKYYEGLAGTRSILNSSELDTALSMIDGNDVSNLTITKTMKFLTQLVCQTMTYLLKSEVERDRLIQEVHALKQATPDIHNDKNTTKINSNNNSNTISHNATEAPISQTLFPPSSLDAYSSYVPNLNLGQSGLEVNSDSPVRRTNVVSLKESSQDSNKNERGLDDVDFTSVTSQMTGASASDWLFKKSMTHSMSPNVRGKQSGVNADESRGIAPMRLLDSDSDTYSFSSIKSSTTSVTPTPSNRMMEPKKSNRPTPDINSKKPSQSSSDASINGGLRNAVRAPVQFTRGDTSRNNVFRQVQHVDVIGSNASEERDLDSSDILNVSGSVLKNSMDDYNNRIYDYIYSQGILASTSSNKSSPERANLAKSDISAFSVGQSQKNANDLSMVDAYDDWMNRMTSSRTSAKGVALEMSSPSVGSSAVTVGGSTNLHVRDISQALSSIGGDNEYDDVNDDDDDDAGVIQNNINDMDPFDEDECDEDFHYSRVVPVPLEAPRHPNSM